MKTKTLKWAATLLVAMGSFAACGNETSDTDCPTCENKTILKTLEEELCFVRHLTFNSIDVRNFYVIEPATSHNEFSKQLTICTNIDLGKYATESPVKISGHVTSCVDSFEGYDIDCECKVMYEYNVFELSSIKKEK